MAPPPPRPALGALFLLLAIAFVGIAAAAAEAVDTNKGLVVVGVDTSDLKGDVQGFAKRYGPSTRKSGERVTPTCITLRELRSMMKKANSEWKKRSVTGRKSQAQICSA